MAIVFIFVLRCTMLFCHPLYERVVPLIKVVREPSREMIRPQDVVCQYQLARRNQPDQLFSGMHHRVVDMAEEQSVALCMQRSIRWPRWFWDCMR